MPNVYTGHVVKGANVPLIVSPTGIMSEWPFLTVRFGLWFSGRP